MSISNEDFNVTGFYDDEVNATTVSPTQQQLPPIDVLYYMLEVMLSILAVVGNFVVLLAYACNRRLRIVSHYHLISLALSDFMMGAITIPLWLAALQGHPKNHFSCLFALSLIMYIDLASVFSLLVMTFDRYIYICWPLHYNVMVTSRRSIISIIASWSLSAIFMLPMPLKWNWSSPDLTICYFVNIVDMKYLVFVFFACILPPIVIMTFMYIHILVEVRKQVSIYINNLEFSFIIHTVKITADFTGFYGKNSTASTVCTLSQITVKFTKFLLLP